MENKKGQLTIFIIVAIIMVIGIIILIMLMRGSDLVTPAEVSPKEFIQKCVKSAMEDSVDKMLDNGGEIIPSHALMYGGEEYNYLCYHGDYYLSCYNLHPMLEYQIESEIKKDIGNDIQACFDSMRQDYENKGFGVTSGVTNYSIDLLPGVVEIKLNKRISLEKDGTSQVFNLFDTKIISSIYELVKISRDVVNSESQYCNFEYNGYMLLYPRYDIRRIDYSDSKIYRLIDRISKEEFRFSVRSCAFAPGV